MTMNAVDTGVQGAKRQSFHEASPRGLLMKLMGVNPNMPESNLLRLFREKVKEATDEGDDYISPIIEYWFAPNYKSLLNLQRPPAKRQAAKAARKAEIDEIKSTVKERIARMVLLDVVLPNGKRLRDCTGKECAKAGGWFAKIAGKVKPTEIVGKVLSETQVRSLYGR